MISLVALLGIVLILLGLLHIIPLILGIVVGIVCLVIGGGFEGYRRF